MMPKIPPLKWIWLIFLAILFIGILLMNSYVKKEGKEQSSLSVPTTEQPVSAKPVDQWSIKEYEDFYNTSLKEILEEIAGVGEVAVMVNLDSSEERVYQKNIHVETQVTDEKDHQGGNRNVDDQARDEEVVMISGSNGEQPIIVKTLKPTVRGVVVVASGADNAKVKSWIYDAVQRALDVPAYKISVVPKKKN